MKQDPSLQHGYEYVAESQKPTDGMGFGFGGNECDGSRRYLVLIYTYLG